MSRDAKNLLVAALAGGTLGLGFVVEVTSVFVFIAVTVGLGAMLRAATPLGAAFAGMLFGGCGCAAAGVWIPAVVLSLGGSLLDAAILWSLISVWGGGLGYAFVGLLCRATRVLPVVVGAILAAGGVFAIETLATTAPLGLPGFLLAHPLRESIGIAQLAALFDLRAVSMAAVASAYITAREHRDRPCNTFAIACAWISIASVGLPIAEAVRATPSGTPDTSLRLLFIQSDLAHIDKWSTSLQRLRLERLAEQTRHAIGHADAPPDLVFWPETSLTQPIDRNADLRSALLAAVDSFEVPLVAGLTRAPNGAVPNRYRNVALRIDPEVGIVGETAKAIAIPLVESGRSLGVFDGLRSLLGAAEAWPRVESRESDLDLPPTSGPEVAVLLCYEALFPGAARHRFTAEARAIINLADDAWANSPLLSRQLATFASYRAIELRLPFVRLADRGRSVAFDEFGRTLESLPLRRADALSLELSVCPGPSTRERAAIALTFFVPGALARLAWCAIGRTELRPRQAREGCTIEDARPRPADTAD